MPIYKAHYKKSHNTNIRFEALDENHAYFVLMEILGNVRKFGKLYFIVSGPKIDHSENAFVDTEIPQISYFKISINNHDNTSPYI